MKKSTLLLIIYICSITYSSDLSLKIGDDAPPISLFKLESNKYFRSKDLLGKKNLVVSFFATWCIPCAKEIPEITELSKDFDDELRFILQKYPEVIKVFPTLLGVRDKKIDVLDSSVLPDFKFREFDFGNPNLFSNDFENYVLFFEKSGLKKLIIDGGLTNIKDYTYGVEVGLDTNGRKNRGGTIMEDLVDDLLQKIYGLDSSTYTTQGSPSSIKEKWGINLPVDKSSRRPDFVVYKNSKLYWIETNFYSGGGSKLKSTCGEYKSLYDFCSNNSVEFIWITDGEGWKTTLKPLEETFLHNDYIFNLSMVKDGVLNDIWG